MRALVGHVRRSELSDVASLTGPADRDGSGRVLGICGTWSRFGQRCNDIAQQMSEFMSSLCAIRNVQFRVCARGLALLGVPASCDPSRPCTYSLGQLVAGAFDPAKE